MSDDGQIRKSDLDYDDAGIIKTATGKWHVVRYGSPFNCAKGDAELLSEGGPYTDVEIVEETDIHLTSKKVRELLERKRDAGESLCLHCAGTYEVEYPKGREIVTDGSGDPEDVLQRVQDGDRLRVTVNGLSSRTETVIVEEIDGPNPDEDYLSPFVETMDVQGHNPDCEGEGDVETWRLSMKKRSDDSWMGPRISGLYYGTPRDDPDGVVDYHETMPEGVSEIEVVSDV